MIYLSIFFKFNRWNLNTHCLTLKVHSTVLMVMEKSHNLNYPRLLIKIRCGVERNVFALVLDHWRSTSLPKKLFFVLELCYLQWQVWLAYGHRLLVRLWMALACWSERHFVEESTSVNVTKFWVAWTSSRVRLIRLSHGSVGLLWGSVGYFP